MDLVLEREDVRVFHIEIAPELLMVDSRSPLFVSGSVWLQMGEKEFPARGWTDAPLSVLGSLGAAIIEVQESGVSDAYFFDGPYFVRFSFEGNSLGEASVKVTGVCDRHACHVSAESIGVEGGGVIEAEAIVSLFDIKNSYAQSLQVFRDWAARNRELEVISALSKMPYF